MKKYPSQEQLKQLLNYNHETGVFTWKSRCESNFDKEKSKSQVDYWNRTHADKVAGTKMKSKSKKPYLVIKIFGTTYYAHRLAIIYMNGHIDQDMDVDHIDGNGLNNSIKNIRAVSRSENNKNYRLYDKNTSGRCGVTWRANRGKYESSIKVNGKSIYLGYYSSFDEACKARKKAEVKYKFHENHGSKRPL